MNLWTVAADAATYLDDATMHRNIAKSKSHPTSCRCCALVYASRISKVVRKITWHGFRGSHEDQSVSHHNSTKLPKQKQLHWISGRWFTNPHLRFSQVDDEHEEKVSAEKMKALSPQIFGSDVFCARIEVVLRRMFGDKKMLFHFHFLISGAPGVSASTGGLAPGDFQPTSARFRLVDDGNQYYICQPKKMMMQMLLCLPAQWLPCLASMGLVSLASKWLLSLWLPCGLYARVLRGVHVGCQYGFYVASISGVYVAFMSAGWKTSMSGVNIMASMFGF